MTSDYKLATARGDGPTYSKARNNRDDMSLEVEVQRCCSTRTKDSCNNGQPQQVMSMAGDDS